MGFLTPFLVALLGWAVLGERLRLVRILAIAVAFAGVMVVIRPGSSRFHPAAFNLYNVSGQ